ncbi:RHS repeat domain-containing protein [Thiocystis violacea]|uniref:RHS repeat domain-containing protein n=1 Tax=Thiocystis violacea TaxID=13725 RepID=UPI0019065A56|nr:RHS repeat domain-containing protein [Thiocystis violacea]MBK1718566.1 hypothetical protein [Thiocystis violacea]
MNRLLPYLAVSLPALLCAVPVAKAASATVTYAYDAIGRLTSVSYSTGQSIQYAFDQAGNIARVSHSGTTPPSPDPDPDPDPTPNPNPDIPPVSDWPNLPDDDDDSIPDGVETLVPDPSGTGQGDGNGDRIPDVQQDDVSSLPWVESPDDQMRFVTLANDSGLGQENVRTQPAPSDAPAGLDLPFGLLGFEVGGVRPGATLGFSVFVDDDIPVNGYFKRNALGVWVDIATTITRVGRKTRIDFEIEDGGEFDADGQVNGRIVDPGAPGFFATPSAVYLSADSGINIFNAVRLHGEMGEETVRLRGGYYPTVDRDIERVELSGRLDSYSFARVGTTVEIREAGRLVVTIRVQGDADGTVLAFSEGATGLREQGSAVLLGNQTLAETARTFTAASLGRSLDTTDGTGSGVFTANELPNAVYLSPDGLITVADLSDVYGSTGGETVQIIGAPSLEIDQNVERVEMDGPLSDYRFQQHGNTVEIWMGNAGVALVAVQGDADGTRFAFSDGAVWVKLSGTTMQFGNQIMNAVAPGGFTATQLGSRFDAADVARFPLTAF